MVTEPQMPPNLSLMGQRVHLSRKGDPSQTTHGVVIDDPLSGETRFRTDEGEEVGAYQWYFSVGGKWMGE